MSRYATVLVSGGHNMVLLTSGIGVHTILGSTLDDSVRPQPLDNREPAQQSAASHP